MKFNSLFPKYLDCSNSTEVFDYFKNTLTDSVTLWNYFVNWDKVLNNFSEVEIYLNLLNYLIGKDNVKESFRHLLHQYPQIVSIIPILLACRNKSFRILMDYSNGNFTYKTFDFEPKNKLTEQEISNILEFTQQTGLLELFTNRTIKNIPDYVFGIEVGLDSNGRKNRSGSTMETIVKSLLHNICQKHNLSLMEQATSSKIQKEWGIKVAVDKSSRRFDFAVKNEEILYLIETNFYGGGGSKLKSTAGEYRALFDFISQQQHKFMWITDGIGWKTALHPLEETFNYIEYTFNLKMVSTGLLSAIITQKL